MENRILIYREVNTRTRHALPLLEKVEQASRPLLIIAGAVEAGRCRHLVINKLRGIMKLRRQGSRLGDDARPCSATSPPPRCDRAAVHQQRTGLKLEKWN